MGNNSSVETGVETGVELRKNYEKSPTKGAKYNIDRCITHMLIVKVDFWSIAIMVHFFLSYISRLNKDDKLIKFKRFLNIVRNNEYKIEKNEYEQEKYEKEQYEKEKMNQYITPETYDTNMNELDKFFIRFLDPNDFITWTNDFKNKNWRKTLPDEYKTYPIDSIPLKLRHNAYVPYITDIYPFKFSYIDVDMINTSYSFMTEVIRYGIHYKANSIYDLLAYGIFHVLELLKFTSQQFSDLTGNSYRKDDDLELVKGKGLIYNVLDTNTAVEQSRFQNDFSTKLIRMRKNNLYGDLGLPIEEIPSEVRPLLDFMVRYC